MPRAPPRLVCKRTRAERKAQRRSLKLFDASLTEATKARYSTGLSRLLETLETVPTLAALDNAVSNWVEKMWEDGEPQYLVADALSGLHFYEPWTKRQLPNSWRLFSVWRKLEIPSRAPPLTEDLIRGMATYALEHDDLTWAGIFLIGFYGLLRTGEIMKLAATDLLVSGNHLIISLQQTKTGKRKGCHEVIHIDDIFTIEVASALIALRRAQNRANCSLWMFSGTAFRKRFVYYCHKFGLESHGFRPYSLRRGGATWHFQKTRSMESALLLGRWESAKVARIYISDGLSFLPQMTYSNLTKQMLLHFRPPL